MSDLLIISLVFGVIIAAQQFFFMHQIHVLLNKAMSRDFNEYQRATLPKAPDIKVNNDIPDDLRILQEFSM